MRLPLLFLLLAVIAVLVAVFVAFGGKPNIGLPGGGDKATTAPTTANGAIEVAAVKDLDPYASPPSENADMAKFAIDGKPRTAWLTSTYRGSPDLGGLKPGVGLLLDLGSVRTVGSVELRLVGQPTNVSLYAAPAATKSRPTGIEGLDKVAAQDDAGTRLTVRPTSATSTRYVVVWLTSLPAVDGGFRGGIAEVVIHG